MTVFKTARIAPYQLISVYILCRAGVFMSFQNQENPLEGFPAVFTSLFSELLIPLLLLPGLLLLRRYPEDTIVHCGYRLCGKWIGALFGGLYLIFFLLTLGIGISQFQLFSSFHLYE